jgi:hypothetical protein|nr:MAG TPA: holin [Caudoviricetes sp.]DAX63906.1 MAG TPA: holin [Caudoviricetes sp.]
MKLSNQVYDILKYVVLIALPAIITFVNIVGVQLGYDMTTTIVIMTAFNALLGTLIGISSVKYNKENE